MRILANSKLGKLALGFFSAAIVAGGVFWAMIASGQRGGDGFFDNLYLTVPFLAMDFFVIGVAVLGIGAIAKDKDYSVVTVAVTILSMPIALFLIADLIFPH